MQAASGTDHEKLEDVDRDVFDVVGGGEAVEFESDSLIQEAEELQEIWEAVVAEEELESSITADSRCDSMIEEVNERLEPFTAAVASKDADGDTADTISQLDQEEGFGNCSSSSSSALDPENEPLEKNVPSSTTATNSPRSYLRKSLKISPRFTGRSCRRALSSAYSRPESQHPLGSRPSAAEIEAFLADAEEKCELNSKSYIERYNFDFGNDRPLPGRYEWVKIQS